MYAIMTPCPNEAKPFLKKMDVSKKETINGKDFYYGKLGEKDCVLCLAGIGKVNAALTTATLLDKHKDIDFVIVTGTSGVLNYDENINIGDIAVATKCIQSDVDLRVLGMPLGYLEGEVPTYALSDRRLLSAAEEAAQSFMKNHPERRVFNTVISTRDQFINDPEKRKRTYQETGASVEAMEGAAVGYVVEQYNKDRKARGERKIRFAEVRVISDRPDKTNEVNYYKTKEKVPDICADYVMQLISCYYSRTNNKEQNDKKGIMKSQRSNTEMQPAL